MVKESVAYKMPRVRRRRRGTILRGTGHSRSSFRTLSVSGAKSYQDSIQSFADDSKLQKDSIEDLEGNGSCDAASSDPVPESYPEHEQSTTS